MVLAKRVCDSVQSDNPLYSAAVLFLHVNNTNSGSFKTEMNGFDGRTDEPMHTYMLKSYACMDGYMDGPADQRWIQEWMHICICTT